MKGNFGNYLIEKASGFRIVSLLGTYIGITTGLVFIWDAFFGGGESKGPIVWALTVATGIYVFLLLMNYCLFTKVILQDEIDRMSKAKAKLELAILKQRKSSNGLVGG